MTQKKTVIVTGGNGFIGTNLIRLLVASREYHVVNLDALTYAANPLSLADLEGDPNYEFVKGNITDRKLIDSLFEKYPSSPSEPNTSSVETCRKRNSFFRSSSRVFQ